MKSEHLNILVQSGVPFFAKAVRREKWFGIGSTEESEYESMVKYMKIVFKDDFYCDASKQLTALDEFNTKDHKTVCNTYTIITGFEVNTVKY